MEKNTYHLFVGGQMELYELLFYREDNEEIKEFNSFAQFKRFSQINIGNYEIKINETIINLKEFLYKNGNSFQLSFYDINNKYRNFEINRIPEKKIDTTQFLNFYQ